MFEEKKHKNGRSIAIKFLPDVPWALKLFILFFVLVLGALLLFGYLAAQYKIPAYDNVTSTLGDVLKVLGGAIVGALSAETKLGSRGGRKTAGR